LSNNWNTPKLPELYYFFDCPSILFILTNQNRFDLLSICNTVLSVVYHSVFTRPRPVYILFRGKCIRKLSKDTILLQNIIYKAFFQTCFRGPDHDFGLKFYCRLCTVYVCNRTIWPLRFARVIAERIQTKFDFGI